MTQDPGQSRMGRGGLFVNRGGAEIVAASEEAVELSTGERQVDPLRVRYGVPAFKSRGPRAVSSVPLMRMRKVPMVSVFPVVPRPEYGAGATATSPPQSGDLADSADLPDPAGFTG